MPARSSWCFPPAFTFVTGAAHWETLCRARAIENQCWLLAANQTGMSPHGFADYGHSMIVDPWGTVVARTGDGEGVALAEIDRGYLARVRRELPCLDHVRLAVTNRPQNSGVGSTRVTSAWPSSPEPATDA